MAKTDLIADSRPEVVARLTKRAEEAGVGPALAAAFVVAATEVMPVTPMPVGSRPGVTGMLVGRFAMRSDDLDLFDAVIGALPGLVTGGFFLAGTPPLAAQLTIAVALLKLLKTMWQKGVRVSPEQVRILTILRSNVSGPDQPGLTVDEIHKILRRSSADLDRAGLEASLAQLATMPAANGSVKALASDDGTGRWRAHV